MKKINTKNNHDGKLLRRTSFNKKELLNSVIMESLNESEREKEQILNSIVEYVFYMDINYRIKWINNSGLKSISSDTSINDILGKPCYKLWHDRDEPCDECPITKTIRTGWPFKEEVTRPDGSTMLVSSQAIIDDNGNMIGIIVIELDITMRKEVERELEKSQQRANALLNVIPDFLLVFGNSGNLIEYHPAPDFDIMTETENPEGKHLSTIILPELAEEILKNSEEMEGIGLSRNFEYALKSDSDEIFYNYRLIKTTETENVCIVRDITTQKSREKEMLLKGFYDKLTGLYNRAYFDEELNRIEQLRESTPTSILVIDVNGLKLTNDAFGHDFGDKLLKIVAEILSSNCRKSDVIARTGGDEFSIILPGSPLSKALKLSERIIKGCTSRRLNDIYIRPSVSIGFAERTDKSVDLKEIIKIADENMYKMKLANRAKHRKEIERDILSSMKMYGLEEKHHTDNCIKMSEDFALYVNMSSESTKKLIDLALIHDIGNIRVRKDLLTKKAPLSEDEMDKIRQHPLLGYRITKAIPAHQATSELVLYHHERWDGTGYPTGLKGKSIPVQCRIFSLVDSFENITTDKVYRKAFTKQEAIEEIRTNRGKQFDPDMTDKFIEFIKDYTFGK